MPNAPADAILLLRPYILPIYRYHLALRGERSTALALTVATLRSARTWLDTYRPSSGKEPLAVWLFSIARYKQSFTARRGRSTLPPASSHLASLTEEIPEAIPEIVPLWQAQLAWLADALRQLPSEQSEALALVCFGGLSPAEAAALLRITPHRIQQLLDNSLASPKQLSALANDINLAESDLEQILNEAAAQPVSHPAWLHRSIWRQAFGLRSFINRVAPAIGLAALLLWAFVNSSRPVPLNFEADQATGQPLLPSSSVVYDLSSAQPRQIQSGPGYLVPPDPDECKYWQGVLKKALSQQADLTRLVPFQNPQASGPSEHGTGCELDLSGTTSDPVKLWAAVQLIRPFFTREDYRVTILDDCSALVPDKSWSCQGQVYSLQAYSRVILTLISQHPPAAGPGGAAADSPANPLLSQFSLRMQLATNPTQLVVDNFLSRWKIGDDLARNDFSSQLLARLPSVSDLDKLAGIDRSPAGQPSFSVQVIQNSGTQLLVQVQVDEIRTPPLPSEPVSTLQLKLARLDMGWKIQQITANSLTGSPPA